MSLTEAECDKRVVRGKAWAAENNINNDLANRDNVKARPTHALQRRKTKARLLTWSCKAKIVPQAQLLHYKKYWYAAIFANELSFFVTEAAVKRRFIAEVAK